jgi:hypothetical protein
MSQSAISDHRDCLPHRRAASYVTFQGAYEGSIPFARSSYFSAIIGQRRSESRRPGPGRPPDVPVAHRLGG